MASDKPFSAAELSTGRLYAVVSLLNEPAFSRVCELWQELEQLLKVHCTYDTPLPHFSYHVAQSYEPAVLQQTLETIAGRTSRFTVRTSGLGLFTGTRLILFVPLVRSPALTELHLHLWPALSSIASGNVHHYHPNQWIPHITLIHNALTPERAAEAASRLAELDFNWEIEVDNLALICNNCGTLELAHRVELR